MHVVLADMKFELSALKTYSVASNGLTANPGTPIMHLHSHGQAALSQDVYKRCIFYRQVLDQSPLLS